ncbi:MAG: hypothetical protein JWL77_7139 [Chthonomonadaceae bacterium]|nr:hypothetical protein [Chthonomonadaceae bacterium]
MKKGFSRWDIFRRNDANRAAGERDDLLGMVEARTSKEALAEAYAKWSLRSEAERDGVYPKKLSY